MTSPVMSNDEIWSGENRIYDYLSIPGINTKFGLNGKDYDIFIIQQLLDNALDFIEQHAKKFVEEPNPYVSVIITEEEEGKVTKIKVRNSNAGINNLFSEEHINKIFKLDRYQSSKRYRHKINRGELGDAFKAILCIPYAIVINKNGENWDYPLEITISNDNRSIKIRINNIDKIRRRENIEVIPEYGKITDLKKQEEVEVEQIIGNFSEIVVYLPKYSVDYTEISDLLKKYIVNNTHINFNIQLPGQIEPHFYNATQELYKDWKNKQSIYSYAVPEAKDLFRTIDKSSDHLNVFDKFIRTDFREGTTLIKDEDFKTLTFGEVKIDDKKIENVIQKLKNNQKPIKYQSTSLQQLEVPFDWKLREEALKERLEQVYEIEEDSFIYKRFNKYYENPNGNGVQFPYKLEVVIAKSPILEENVLTLIESLNFSPSLNPDLFTANDSIFFWKNYKTDSILDILSDCGYSIYNNGQHKKPNNLMLVNLITPRVDYNSFSKSNINLLPFAEGFCNEFYRTCKRAITRRNKTDSEEETNIGQLRILLKERLDAATTNPELTNYDRWTQSTIYYTLRKRLLDKKIDVKRREYITGIIKDECHKLGIKFRGKGFKRHELGIIAAERAQLYFNYQVLGIGFDQLQDLMKKGTDLLVIEKEGIADILAPFADEVGIAILNSRGFLTEYASELSKLAEENGCNIAILTDLDSSGLLISSKLPNAHRIGIDFETLDHFGLSEEDVQEVVERKGNGDDNHLPTLKKLPKSNIPLPYRDNLDDWNRLLNFLDTGMRIEIDSIRAEVNNNEEFWDYIIAQLTSVFPTRDYNRAINIPDFVLPKLIDKMIKEIENIVSDSQKQLREEIKNDLMKVEGFYAVKEKTRGIRERLMSPVSKLDSESKNKISNTIMKFLGSYQL